MFRGIEFQARRLIDKPGFILAGTEVEIVRRYAQYAGKLKPEQRTRIEQELQEKLNQGGLSKQFIQALDDTIVPASISDTPTKSDFKRDLDDPSKVHWLYAKLITSATSKESVPYLLQTLGSRYVYREEEPSVRMQGLRMVNDQTPYTSDFPWSGKEETVLISEHGENIEVSSFTVHSPFRDLAFHQLNRLLPLIPPTEFRGEIHKALNAHERVMRNPGSVLVSQKIELPVR